mmetsp:Transcript_9206/g.20320  ORF Transcript_9206/g.20320 Transcript_9206/m.20320 type:complete len:229 (+) Transcript_9206:1013-1699(+)
MRFSVFWPRVFFFSAMACSDISYSRSVSCSLSATRARVTSLGASSCLSVCSCVVSALRSFSSSTILTCISLVFCSHLSDICVRTSSSALAVDMAPSSSPMRPCDQSTAALSRSTSASISWMEPWSFFTSRLDCTSPVSRWPLALSSSCAVSSMSSLILHLSSVCLLSSAEMDSSFCRRMNSKYCSTVAFCFSDSCTAELRCFCAPSMRLSLERCSSARSMRECTTYSS